MTFKQDLYDKIKTAVPDMTVRLFSRYCGKSDGYYGSITAQSLPLSTDALVIIPFCKGLRSRNVTQPWLVAALV